MPGERGGRWSPPVALVLAGLALGAAGIWSPARGQFGPSVSVPDRSSDTGSDTSSDGSGDGGSDTGRPGRSAPNQPGEDHGPSQVYTGTIADYLQRGTRVEFGSGVLYVPEGWDIDPSLLAEGVLSASTPGGAALSFAHGGVLQPGHAELVLSVGPDEGGVAAAMRAALEDAEVTSSETVEAGGVRGLRADFTDSFGAALRLRTVQVDLVRGGQLCELSVTFRAETPAADAERYLAAFADVLRSLRLGG